MTIDDEILVFSHSLNAREQEIHQAGAERPKVGPDDTFPPKKVASSVYTTPGPKTLSLKLREQAKKLGLKPGEPRWRAYVLGTQAAAARRKRQKAKKRRQSETGLVTPVK